MVCFDKPAGETTEDVVAAKQATDAKPKTIITYHNILVILHSILYIAHYVHHFSFITSQAIDQGLWNSPRIFARMHVCTYMHGPRGATRHCLACYFRNTDIFFEKKENFGGELRTVSRLDRWLLELAIDK